MVQNPKLLPRYITIIAHCHTHCKVVTDPIPLLPVYLEYFSAEQPNDTLLLTIHPIIETICHKYKDRVIGEEEICAHLLQIYMSTSMRLFDPDDKFVLSKAIFFKQFFLTSAQRRMHLLCGSCAQRTNQSLPASSSSFQS